MSIKLLWLLIIIFTFVNAQVMYIEQHYGRKWHHNSKYFISCITLQWQPQNVCLVEHFGHPFTTPHPLWGDFELKVLWENVFIMRIHTCFPVKEGFKMWQNRGCIFKGMLSRPYTALLFGSYLFLPIYSSYFYLWIVCTYSRPYTAHLEWFVPILPHIQLI